MGSELGLATVFIGGALVVLSPCGALLLPAFFASSVGKGPRLAVHALVFYLGLAALLVPLGAGVSAMGQLFAQYRSQVIVGASVLLGVFGVLQVMGWGFDVSRHLPGVGRVEDRARSSAGLAKSFLLGVVSGVSGFCAGPVLGAVLTMAASQGDALGGASLMAVYCAGMLLPLVVLATVWDGLGDRWMRVLRGRTFTLFGRQFHSTSVITGLLIIAAGVLLWATDGLLGVPALVPDELQYALQNRLGESLGVWGDVLLVLVVAVVVAVLWIRRRAAALKDVDGD